MGLNPGYLLKSFLLYLDFFSLQNRIISSIEKVFVIPNINIFLFLQSSIMSLSQQKSDLFHTNVEIHNFLAELSCCPGVSFNTPPSSLGRKDKQQHNVSFVEFLSGCTLVKFGSFISNLSLIFFF